jgi:hypothetical protein
MKPRVCIGCGEAISEKGNILSSNPNLCTSCSSLTDGLEELEAAETVHLELAELPFAEKPPEFRKAA